jgi:hypothetical protein
VPQGETEPILARFGQNELKGIRREVLQLINVEVKISPALFLGVCPRHGGLLKLRDEKRAQQPAILFPEFALREVPDKDAPLIHGSAKAKRARGLAQDVPHQ